MKFDEIISLGYNCEVSFRIKDFLGEVKSFPYTWTYCIDRELFIESIINPHDILSGEVTLLPWGMIKCEKYALAFHPTCDHNELFIKGEPNKSVFNNELNILRSKLSYLSEKLENLYNSDKSVLFVVKVACFGEESDIRYINKLHTIISEKCNNITFKLLAVLENQYLSMNIKSLECKTLEIRSVNNFATDQDTQNGGDIQGWGNIFKEILK